MTALRTETPPLLSGLYTDRYELSMAWVYWREGQAEVPAVFDFYFRTLPFGGGVDGAHGRRQRRIVELSQNGPWLSVAQTTSLPV